MSSGRDEYLIGTVDEGHTEMRAVARVRKTLLARSAARGSGAASGPTKVNGSELDGFSGLGSPTG